MEAALALIRLITELIDSRMSLATGDCTDCLGTETTFCRLADDVLTGFDGVHKRCGVYSFVLAMVFLRSSV